MSQKHDRESRRETKRTLGRHLEEYAANHLTRLDHVEACIKAFEEQAVTKTEFDRRCGLLQEADDHLGDDISQCEQTLERVYEVTLSRGFFGRLKWLLTGR